MSYPDFEEVYQTYFIDVYKFLLALCQNYSLAEELTQDTFIKAMQNYTSFRGDCKVRVWLCQIAKNSYYHHVDHKVRMTSVDIETIDIKDDLSLEIQFADKEQAFRIHTMLHEMQEPYKEVFTLRVLGELSFRDIARLLSKTESWARVTFHRAKLKIIHQLQEVTHE